MRLPLIPSSELTPQQKSLFSEFEPALRFGDAARARQAASTPGLEVRNERRDANPVNCKTFIGGLAVDLALDIEDGVDVLERFERQRGDHGQLAARLGGDIGEHEELAPAMRPASSLHDGPERTRLEPAAS
jgi:hypothetical protein